MKITEITESTNMSEAPSGALAGLASKAMGKIPGGKATAANLAARADVADTAKNLYNELSGHLGIQDKTIKQATGQDVANFLATKGHKLTGASSQQLDRKEVGRILTQVARNEMQGKKITNIGKGAKQKIPAAVYQAIQDLSPEQRQALKDLL